MKGIFFGTVLVLMTLNACQDRQKRDSISLNGVWQIAEGSMDKIPVGFDHSVQVPGLVSLATPPFRDPGPRVKNRRSLIQKDTLREAFWYSRTFIIDKQIPDKAVLKVSKAMFGTKVFLNGKDLGEHLPCFTPGYFNVKDALVKGENKLMIRVGSSRNSIPFSVPDGFDFEKDRYIPGIFDNVELILSGLPDIISVQAAPDIYKKQVRVQATIGNPGKNTSRSLVVRESKSATGRIVEKTFPRNREVTWLK
jgi:hypothetical protein